MKLLYFIVMSFLALLLVGAYYIIREKDNEILTLRVENEKLKDRVSSATTEEETT